MAGSALGTILRVTTWGESHGKGIGVVVDGCPAGLPLEEGDIQSYLNRRKPGQSKFTTARQEGDQVEILSGVFGGRTTGTPIALEVRNTDQRSHDYSNIMDIYRPGHADYTFDQKYGFRDYRGGGRSSGRETIARVAAGAIACKLLESLGITVRAYTREVGGICIAQERFDLDEMWNNRLYMPDARAAVQAEARLEELMAGKDSCGGVVECIIRGMPAGAGEPVFEKLDANLAKAMLSIGAVKGFEIGDGFAASRARGSENNDGFGISHKAADGSPHLSGRIEKQTNHSGGTLGGISDGSDIVMRAAFKPTPSIAQPQHTVNQNGEETVVEIKGRHDPIIVPRAVVVVEAMAALTAADMLLLSMTSRLDRVQAFFVRDRV
ncbi:chorismate synthase [Enterocloster sp.]|jgi:chorismate synthase|uniref:chorismate synthase n=1 Tax=Enterocloster sp. TaxID=2719315 RepID=UPI00257EE4BB|nr:chorismate synthase [Enterocloster sp.]MBS5407093.1 chorismate synthase [Enterocloster sp.]